MNASQISPADEPVGVTLQRLTHSPRRILVVDDDDDIRRLNTEVLIHYGYHVDAAADGAVAWEALNAAPYDLLITDHDMPRVTGVELLKKLHGTPMALPVIMVTGIFPSREFARHPWIQTPAALLKPYTVAELLGAVEKVLCVADPAIGQVALPPDRHREPSPDRLRL